MSSSSQLWPFDAFLTFIGEERVRTVARRSARSFAGRGLYAFRSLGNAADVRWGNLFLGNSLVRDKFSLLGRVGCVSKFVEKNPLKPFRKRVRSLACHFALRRHKIAHLARVSLAYTLTEERRGRSMGPAVALCENDVAPDRRNVAHLGERSSAVSSFLSANEDWGDRAVPRRASPSATAEAPAEIASRPTTRLVWSLLGWPPHRGFRKTVARIYIVGLQNDRNRETTRRSVGLLAFPRDTDTRTELCMHVCMCIHASPLHLLLLCLSFPFIKKLPRCCEATFNCTR